MARGRKATPAEIADAKGNPGRRKRAGRSVSVPVSPGGIVSPLPLDSRQRAMWDQVIGPLTAMNILRPGDAAGIARYAIYLVEWADMRAQILAEGATNLVKSAHNPDGLRRKHPLLDFLNSLENRLLALEDRYGLNPAARQTLLQQIARNPMGQGDLYARESPPPSEATDGPLGILLN